jgi:hypothetical protein
MAKRKREIQRRKKQQEPRSEHLDKEARDQAIPDPGWGTGSGEALHQDDNQVTAPDPKRDRQPRGEGIAKKRVPPVSPDTVPGDSRFSNGREKLLLGLLFIYVFLLGLGTVGELFEIEWILNLRIFK